MDDSERDRPDSLKYVPKIFAEIELEYTRSRGPGGQHVNRTNSACLLRWNLLQSQAFLPEEVAWLKGKLNSQLTGEGEIMIRSEEYRDQESNRKRCLEKLDQLLEKAFFVPKARKATKPTRSSQRKRRVEKKVRGEIKSGRGKVQNWED